MKRGRKTLALVALPFAWFGAIAVSGCAIPASGPMVISNTDAHTVYIRVAGPPGTKEDFKVLSGDRADLVTTVQPVQKLVAFNESCDVVFVMDFSLAESPFSAGGLISFDVGHLAEFVPGKQASTGIEADASSRCAGFPTSLGPVQLGDRPIGPPATTGTHVAPGSDIADVAGDGPQKDLDAAMPACAPTEVPTPLALVTVIAHPDDINDAPVQACDVRERANVSGPPKQPVPLALP